MNLPVLTIAIPTYNRRNLLPHAIRSALAISRFPIEVLVSDNASTDGTELIATEFSDVRIRWFRQKENLGMVNNWQFLLKEARGEWFIMLSDDDKVNSGVIEHAIKIGTNYHARLVIVSSKIVNNINNSTYEFKCPSRSWKGPSLIHAVMSGNFSVVPAGCIFRTVYLSNIGYVGHGYQLVMDAHAWFSVAKDGVVVTLKDIGCEYAIQPTSSSHAGLLHNDECWSLFQNWKQLLMISEKSALINRIRNNLLIGRISTYIKMSRCRKGNAKKFSFTDIVFDKKLNDNAIYLLAALVALLAAKLQLFSLLLYACGRRWRTTGKPKG